MAALLKKRALAEFSQVTLSEEPQKVLKKLKLVKKVSRQPKVELDLTALSATSSAADVLHVLLQISETPNYEFPDVTLTWHKLLDIFKKQKDACVRVKIIDSLVRILTTRVPQSSGAISMDDIIQLSTGESSHKVLAQILDAILRVTKVIPLGDEKTSNRVLALAQKCLLDTNFMVKCKSLELIGQLTPHTLSCDNVRGTLLLLSDYTKNHDCRVRTAAFNSMLSLHERGIQLDLLVYEEAVHSLADNYEVVRLVALQIIVQLARLYPEHLIELPDGEAEVRLVDDAFAKICSSINDISMKVRTRSAELLGLLTGVSPQFLAQTLDKKLMSNMRRKCSAHERAKEVYKSGEWATGQKWADDAPKEEVESESVSLITSGACGAFVHGLEDEYLEVRGASLDSMTQLALQSPGFAITAIDFLVDMFNDEIEEIRLKAIECLTTISQHIVLREDQLEIILACLEDFSMDIREALHTMLAAVRVGTRTGLKLCFDHILDNLKRYPQDQKSIFKCLQLLGDHHPELVLHLTTELLLVHPYFSTQEPNFEEPSYICHLILIFNAAKHCPTMIPLFERHTVKHYYFLKNSYPSLIPHIRLPYQPTLTKIDASGHRDSTAFLLSVLDSVAMAVNVIPRIRQEIQERAIGDLKRLSEIDSTLSAAAQCASLYISSQLIISKVLNTRNWLSLATFSPQQAAAVKTSIERLLQLTFRLNHSFVGLQPTEMAAIRQIRLKALALQLVHTVKGSNLSALTMCDTFLEQMEQVQKFLVDNDLQPDAFTSAMFYEIDKLEEPKPGAVARIVHPLLQKHLSPLFSVGSHIRQSTAVINEPSKETELPLKFLAGLVLGVHLDAHVENVENWDTLRVRVKYPDQQVELIMPQHADIRLVAHSPNERRLYTTVLVSHSSVWSEACHVEISLVLDYADSGSNGAGLKNASGNRGGSDDVNSQVIELCAPVKVFVYPKSIGKGI